MLETLRKQKIYIHGYSYMVKRILDSHEYLRADRDTLNHIRKEYQEYKAKNR